MLVQRHDFRQFMYAHQHHEGCAGMCGQLQVVRQLAVGECAGGNPATFADTAQGYGDMLQFGHGNRTGYARYDFHLDAVLPGEIELFVSPAE